MIKEHNPGLVLCIAGSGVFVHESNWDFPLEQLVAPRAFSEPHGWKILVNLQMDYQWFSHAILNQEGVK